MSLKSWQRLVMERVPLADKTFYGIAGQAEYWAEVAFLEDLVELIDECQRRQIFWRVLGGGSNVLIQAGVLKGLTLRLDKKRFGQFFFEGSRCVVGAGLGTPLLAQEAAQRNFSSAVMIGGIPGTVGGALAMNAGTPEGAIGDLVVSVTFFNMQGELQTWDRHKCRFAYRSSSLKEQLIVSAVLDFGEIDLEVSQKLQQWVVHKTQSQPYDKRSAGCMFRNPPGLSAGQLIDAAGFKGKRKGDIEVSQRHANFLINHGQGTFADVRELMQEICEEIAKTRGIDLVEEVVIWEN